MTKLLPERKALSSLADVALEFCIECLEWQNATIRPHFVSLPTPGRPDPMLAVGDVEHVQNPVWPAFHCAVGYLQYTNLDDVLEAAREWTEKNDADLCLLSLMCRKWSAIIKQREGKPLSWSPRLDSPSHAILAACVEAQRVLKARAA